MTNERRRFFVSVILNGGSALIAQGATLLLLVIVSRMLGPSGVAPYAVAQNTILASASVCQFGLAFTATNFIARLRESDPARARSIARASTVSAILISTFVALVLGFGASTIASSFYQSPGLKAFLIVAAITVPLVTVALVQSGVLNGLELFPLLARANITGAVALITCGAAGAVFGGAIGATIGVAIAAGVRYIYLTAIVERELTHLASKSELLPYRETMRSILKFAVPAGLTGLTLAPAIWFTNAILIRESGAFEFGLLASAFAIKSIVVFVPQQIGSVYLPRYLATHARDPASARRGFAKMSWGILFISAALALAADLGSAIILQLFGREFAIGGPILTFLMIAAVAESVCVVMSYWLAGRGKMWSSFLIYSTPKDIILVLAAIVLIPDFGARGLAMAHALSWIFAVMMLSAILVFSKRPERVPAGELG